jgi:hypothetical protein
MSPQGTKNVKKQSHMQHEKKGTLIIIRIFSIQNDCSTASLRMVVVMGCPSGYKLYMQ